MPTCQQLTNAALRNHSRGKSGRSQRRLLNRFSWKDDTPPREQGVSVVIPVFGSACQHSLEESLKSLAEQSCDPEVVVSEQVCGNSPRFEEISGDLGARHICDEIRGEQGGPYWNDGRARNMGLLAATRSHVYFTDADIVFPLPTFLDELLSMALESEELCFRWPPMKHLPSVGGGDSPSPEADSLNVERLRQVGNWIVCKPDHEALVRSKDFREIVDDRGKWFIIDSADLAAYDSEHDRWSGWEPLIWLSCRHDGAVFASHRQLQVVAGYSERYRVWGGDDADLQWKLGQLFCMVDLDNSENLFVLHLDHERPWYSSYLFERNKLIARNRREASVWGAILDDLSSGESLFARTLREKWSITIEAMPRLREKLTERSSL